MIFLTVGTTKFPFQRLLKAVDEALIKIGSKEELIVQSGVSVYQFNYKNVRVFREIPFDKLINYFKEARVIISHGGPATIFLALKYGQNKPLIIPRLSEFKEHVNNHQNFFVDSFKKNKMIVEILSSEKVEDIIATYLKKPVALKKIRKLEVDENLIKNLNNYMELIK